MRRPYVKNPQLIAVFGLGSDTEPTIYYSAKSTGFLPMTGPFRAGGVEMFLAAARVTYISAPLGE